MSKKTASSSVIALEIGKFKSKIQEFQDYLQQNNIMDMIGSEERFKEIDLQIKMTNALPGWLTSLKSLEESTKDRPTELRGGSQINDAAKIMMERQQ